MGHMSIPYIKYLFPIFFSFVSSLDIDCEVCQLSKHVKNSYPLSNYKSSISFSIVHVDVWGLAPTTMFGFQYFGGKVTKNAVIKIVNGILLNWHILYFTNSHTFSIIRIMLFLLLKPYILESSGKQSWINSWETRN